MENVVSDEKVWFITGASRGMGADFAKAALAAGHSVVASGRDTDRVSKALGQANDLMPAKLDVTRSTDDEAAVRAAVDRFGRIDVLVNNAASFYAGFFEELTAQQFDRQLTTSLIGPMNVTRAVLSARDAQTALRPHHLDLVGRWPRRWLRFRDLAIGVLSMFSNEITPLPSTAFAAIAVSGLRCLTVDRS
jgi:NAD(P)-dependent dehydrogenase (short-subunit alcohol dehydrogenase family)